MIKYLLFLFVYISTHVFTQENNLISEHTSNENIFLIGEAHFVQEKYDEIKAFAFDKIDNLNKGDKISFFFELPFSLNLAFDKLSEHGDSTVFCEWFNHLYQTKNQSLSSFWSDYRDMILALKRYADFKNVELELIGIDTELELRRTAFILSKFENKVDMTIDSLLKSDYIRNDSLTRNIILNQVYKLSEISKDEIELNILERLKKSLTIGCTICIDRDKFMISNFTQFYDSMTQLNFISLGLDHIVSKHDFSKASPLFKMKYKIDTTNYQSFYELLSIDLRKQTYRVGILALNNKLKFSSFLTPKKYTTIMNVKERLYLENQLLDKNVYRVNLRENKALNNLSEQLDYLIIYKVSQYRED